MAAGGVLGAEARLAVTVAVPSAPAAFPAATLLVNASGCLLIGVLMALLVRWSPAHPLARPFLGVGLLGGYTTFSAYAVDIQRLLTAGQAATALGYLVVTPLASVAAAALGSTVTRRLVRVSSWGGAR